MSSSRTKDHIIHTAIQLFNEYGTGAISTNTIAQAAGISPGNLYYHYHNKEDIIRAILDVMVKDWDSVWITPKDDWSPSVEDLKWIIRINLQLQLKYRFFYRELIILIKADPTLQQLHEQIQKDRMQEQQAFFLKFVNAGVIHLDRPSEMESLLTSCWIISNYWLSFLESSGMPTDESQVERGIELILTILKPYLTESK